MTIAVPQDPDHAVSCFDRSDRLRMQFTGTKAAESLTGLVTNDVLALRGSDGLYACALTAKGRVIADVRVLAMPSEDGVVTTLLVDANAAGGVGFAAMIRKYVNPRLAKYLDVSASTSCLSLDGPGAIALLQSLGADATETDAVAGGPDFTHRAIVVANMPVRLARVPDLGAATTFDLHLERSSVEAMRDALIGAGAVARDAVEWHRRRVLAGRPEWGVDMDESTLAQEANMDALHAISYRKGCYTGQETVARVHFRGHVNRTLRRVSYPGATVPAIGTSLIGPEGAPVGDARSTADDQGGNSAGIAMLRREVATGSTLVWLDIQNEKQTAVVLDAADEA
ncbi:MAG: hypothetical protein H7099_13365 [Gemmatimonadaceae bacterium]|nr:hypothetical protein [Gemmatimonadaceae bacterium]